MLIVPQAGTQYPMIFVEGRIGKMTLRNRTVVPPMGMRYSDPTSGAPSERLTRYHARQAEGGVALIITGSTAVDYPLGQIEEPYQSRIDHDRTMAGHFRLTEAVHTSGARIACQLNHAGRLTNPEFIGQAPVAPSAIPRYNSKVIPRALTLEEIKELVAKFAAAAFRAKRSGYDAVELHGAHGYLLHQFVSPKTNQRDDMYGGSTENRVRFSREVISAIRARVGRDFPIIYRLSVEGGYALDECKRFISPLEEAGVDAFDLDTGGITPSTVLSYDVSPMTRPQGWIIPQIAEVKKVARVPVIACNEIKEPAFANRLLEEGKADFVALGRAILADPDWVLKAARGRADEIRLCPSCGHCLGNSWPSRCCSANAELGLEETLLPLSPAARRLHVLVVGAGLAGMEAARIAAQRGHKVSLFDREPHLGGQLTLAATPPGKERLLWFRDYLASELRKYGVQVNLGIEVDRDLVERIRPDAVVLASGSVPLVPQGVDGIRQPNVTTAFAILSGQKEPGEGRIVVVGGTQTACETVEFLRARGKDVSLVADVSPEALAGDCPVEPVREALKRRMKSLDIQATWTAELVGVSAMDICVRQGTKEMRIPADQVVLALGRVPHDKLAREIGHLVDRVYLAGDCFSPRSFREAVAEGAKVGRMV